MTDAAEELYALPPGEFTRARDELAKKLRTDGDREAAAEVKKLRKPTVAAWAINALARKRRADLGRLLDAGEALRAAQAELLAGGDRAAFQDAAATERELVAKLTGEVAELAADAGERPSAGLEEKVAATLHAAALDEETAEEVRTGRLVREREAIGGFGGLGAAAPTSASKPRQSKTEARQPKQAKARAKKDDGEAARRREQLAAARTDERHARRELEAAEKTSRSAETRAEAAEAHAADAVKRAKTAAERLKEARKKESAARKAHARAERALKKAGSD